jgi:TolA-binding protein
MRAIRTGLILITLAVVVMTSAAIAQTETGGADRDWRFIEKLRADGMEDLALRQLEAFATQYPNDPRAPRALLDAAQGEAELGRPMRARTLCEDLLERFPSSSEAPTAALLRADQLSEESRWVEAAEAYRALLSAYPGSQEAPAARLGLGESMMSMSQDDEARRLFSGLLSAQTPSAVAARARFDLGVLDLKAGADSLAIERFESIHLQHPTESIGAFGLVRAAELLEAREANQAAATRYETVIKDYDNPVLRARARLGLARLVEDEDPARAVELYRAVLEEGASREDLKAAYLGLGRSALSDGDTKLAGSISTAFLERFGDEPEADRARLIRAEALLEDQPALGVKALEDLGRSADADVAWRSMEILAARDGERGDLDSASLRWRQAEANASDPERKAVALLAQTRIAMEQGRFGLAADLGMLVTSTTALDTLAARGLQLAARAEAASGDLDAAIVNAGRCSREYPLAPAASIARSDLAVWSRMSVADPARASAELSRIALDPALDPQERAVAVGSIQRDLMGDYAGAALSFQVARDVAPDPAGISESELELARTAQLAALDAGLRGDERAARGFMRDARDALIEVASRPGAEALAMRGRIELYGLDLAAAARPDAPWLFDPRTMPLLGAVGRAEDVDPSAVDLDDTRRRIASTREEATGDARAWLAWRSAELSRSDLAGRLALVEDGLDAAGSADLRTTLTYTRGHLRLMAEEYADAARDFARVVEQEALVELSVAARYGLAEAQRSLRRFDQAGELYDEFAAAWPDTRRGQRAMLLAGDCALFAGRPDDAVGTYRRLLDRYPDSIYRDDALYRLGTALERAGKVESARKPLWTLVDGREDSGYRGRALARLARIEQATGQDSLAVVVLARLVEADPARAVEEDAWVTLASLELGRGRPAEALDWARAQPEGSGDLALATALEVQALAALGRTSEASDRLEALSLANPDRPELVAFSRVHLAEALAAAGNDGRARSEFERARSEASERETIARAAYGEGLIAVRAQRLADARSAFEMSRDVFPGSDWAAESNFKLGQIYLRDGEPAAARSAFLSVADDFPRHPRAPASLRALAQAWRNEGRYDRAIEVYHRILDDYPESEGAPQVLANIAYCHHEMRQHEVAITAYRQVMPLLEEEEQAYAQFWVADSLDQLGRHEEAATEFLRIPFLFPEMGQLGVTAQLKAGEAWEHQGDVAAARQIYERVLSAHGAQSQWGAEAVRRLQRLESATGG